MTARALYLVIPDAARSSTIFFHTMWRFSCRSPLLVLKVPGQEGQNNSQLSGEVLRC